MMHGREWLLGLVLLGVGWPVIAAGGEPDPEAVRRLMEKYEREAAEEAAKPTPAVDHDREAWQSAEKCGTAACFRAYLEDYPKGRYAKMARARLQPKSESRPVGAERSTPRPPRLKSYDRLPRSSVGARLDAPASWSC